MLPRHTDLFSNFLFQTILGHLWKKYTMVALKKCHFTCKALISSFRAWNSFSFPSNKQFSLTYNMYAYRKILIPCVHQVYPGSSAVYPCLIIIYLPSLPQVVLTVRCIFFQFLLPNESETRVLCSTSASVSPIQQNTSHNAHIMEMSIYNVWCGWMPNVEAF